jgi:hypothetical protein
LGLAEKRTGIRCIGAQSGYSGAKRWEEKQPAAAAALRLLAESQSQQEPTFQSSIAYTRLTSKSALEAFAIDRNMVVVIDYTRLTSKSALEALRQQGFSEESLPSVSGMALILNRMGYRLRKVLKAKPKKSA